ncbi:MAG: sialate O-acetylesterase [Phycisphaerales bacterium]|nr:sialate O-acetylesterase [Phycisphaerales bacterium]
MKSMLTLVIASTVQFAVHASVQADLSVANLFSDHMVLQQGVENSIWGWADPESEVAIVVSGHPPVKSNSDEGGRWQAELPILDASSDAIEITVESGDDSIKITDVLVGEVWFCSGQSNMAWRVHSCDKYEEFKADADRPTIRMFTLGLSSVDAPTRDVEGRWVVCSPETVGDFSGTAYHMGRTISDELDVPVGLVNSSWGGSSAEAWIDPERLSWVSPGRRVQKQFQELERERLLDRDQFVQIDMDDSTWLEGAIPGHTRAFGIADDVDGIFWTRIPLEIPKRWTGRPLRLSLGMVDDDDITYFNGVKVGSTNGWQQPRRYDIPARLVSPGPAMVAMRVTDGAGPGGIHGESETLFVHPIDDPDDRISLAGPARMLVAAEVQNLANQHKPSHLYNGMLYPIKDYTFAGAAWYQGENNAIGEGRADEYHLLLPLMIESWRETFDDPDMPFLIVQLPNWDHGDGTWNYPRLREAQRLTHQSVPGTGLIVTTDIGDSGDIHPRNKHDVGDRLGRWALVDVYGVEGIVQAGPIPRRAIWSPDQVTIEFDTFGSRLAVRGKDGSPALSPYRREVAGFEVVDSEGDIRRIGAIIGNGGKVIVKLPETARSTPLIRYSWAPDPSKANLINANGMPASQFEYHRSESPD